MADLVTITSGANSTLPANTVISTRQLDDDSHMQTVMAGPEGLITAEWTFTSAPTDNTALVTVGAGRQIAVTQATVTVDFACTDAVGIRLGFATASLGALSTSAVSGIFLSHPGIAPGSGIVRGDGSGVIGEGSDGQDIRIIAEAASGGSLRVNMTYFIKDVS